MHMCEACLQLESDGRRRTPHDALRLVNSHPAERMLDSGFRVRTLEFACRNCGTDWKLCDVDQSLFVNWIAVPPQPSAPAVRAA